MRQPARPVEEPADPSPNVLPVEGMVRSPAPVVVETVTPKIIYFFRSFFLLKMKTDFLPQEFQVEYGPFLYPEESFTIHLRDDVLYYSPDSSEDNQEEISPAEEEWNRFWQELDELGVWDWNLHYDLCCLDGTRWRVKIVYSDLEVESSGENDYPDNFLGFWEALEELLDRDLKLDI